MGEKIRSFFLEIIFVASVYFVLLLIVFLVSLLKLFGRFKEIEQEPFPQNAKGLIISMNHQDGNEWFFVYPKFFRLRYLIMPWSILGEFPYAMADKSNFYRSIIARPFLLRIMPVDRQSGDKTEQMVLVRKCVELLKLGAVIIGFFEGTRTWKAKAKLSSKLKDRPLGQLHESLGIMAKLSSSGVKSAWMEFPGMSFHSLTEEGHFSLIRFLWWYWKILFGQNGRIVLVWGLTQRFNGQSREEITRAAVESLLALADVA